MGGRGCPAGAQYGQGAWDLLPNGGRRKVTGLAAQRLPATRCPKDDRMRRHQAVSSREAMNIAGDWTTDGHGIWGLKG